MSLKGSCLCGAVNYEIERLNTPIGHCHCRTSRKVHASASTTTAGVVREHFRWVSGRNVGI